MRTMKREFYIPKDGREIKDKNTDAVVYLTEHTDHAGNVVYCLHGFCGKRNKPDFHYRYRTPEARDEEIKYYFDSRKATLEYKKNLRKEHKAAKRGVEVGDILVASWGYEQTNIDYYQVTDMIGKTMVEVRKINGEHVEDTSWMTGKSKPSKDNFTDDEPMRRVAKNGGVKIDSVRWAHKCGENTVHNWTAYY